MALETAQEKTKVAVIGAGISGLACAAHLLEADVDVSVYESSGHAGGKIQSEMREDFLLEHGPNSYKITDNMRQVHTAMSLDESTLERPMADYPRYIYDGDSLCRAPQGLVDFLCTSLLPFSAKMKIALEPLRTQRPTRDDESLADFAKRHFGKDMLDTFIAPFVSGIYAGDSESLSTPAAFPLLYAWAREKGSVVRGAIAYFRKRKKELAAAHKEAGPSTPAKPRKRMALCSFEGGLSDLPKALANKLAHRITYNMDIQSLEAVSEHPRQHTWRIRSVDADGNAHVAEVDGLVMAVPAYAGAKLLENTLPEVAAPLSEIPYTPLVVVHAGINLSDLSFEPVGFGFLSKQKTNLRTLGGLWTSVMFSKRAPAQYALITLFYGGATDPGILQEDDRKLRKIVMDDLATSMGFSGKEIFFNVTRHAQALPAYNMGHLDRLSRAKQAAACSTSPIWLVGNYMGGIALPDCVDLAESCADEMAKSMSSQSDESAA